MAAAVIDLNAERAARLEAAGEASEVRFGDAVFFVPPPKAWPLTALDAMAAGELVSALRALCGDEATDAFLSGGAVLADLEALFTQLAASQGLTTGE